MLFVRQASRFKSNFAGYIASRQVSKPADEGLIIRLGVYRDAFRNVKGRPGVHFRSSFSKVFKHCHIFHIKISIFFTWGSDARPPKYTPAYEHDIQCKFGVVVPCPAIVQPPAKPHAVMWTHLRRERCPYNRCRRSAMSSALLTQTHCAMLQSM